MPRAFGRDPRPIAGELALTLPRPVQNVRAGQAA